MREVMVWFPRLSHNKLWSFWIALLDFLLWEKPLTRLLWDSRCPMKWTAWKGTENPTNSQYQLVSHVSESPWKKILQPQSNLQITAAPADVWLWLHERSLVQPSHASPAYLTHQNKEIIIDFLRYLNTRVIYYAALGNWCCQKAWIFGQKYNGTEATTEWKECRLLSRELFGGRLKIRGALTLEQKYEVKDVLKVADETNWIKNHMSVPN